MSKIKSFQVFPLLGVKETLTTFHILCFNEHKSLCVENCFKIKLFSTASRYSNLVLKFSMVEWYVLLVFVNLWGLTWL